MVIVSNGWIENVEDNKTLLGSSGLIMASPGNINSTENSVRSDWKPQANINVACNRNGADTEDCARAVLISQPNSHPFQTRTLLLEPNVVKQVGRAITRNRVADNNAIFDCKVLSRNHAVLWYNEKRFYVKDTGSSNGTFINDRRINKLEEEELHSGDVIKFGVDVVENSRKEVHGCIIAYIKLYLPDGRECISNNSSRLCAEKGTISANELYSLHQYIQESVQREKILETKLHDIQKVIEVMRQNTTSCWQAMIDEDRLLNRIDILENKLQFLQKHTSEDRLKEEIMKLQDDKSVYQNSAKEALRKVYQERMEAMQKLSTIERALCNSEDECSLLRDQLLQTQRNLQEVNSRVTRFEAECKEHRENNEKAQTQVQKQDLESQVLYAQLKQLEIDCQEYKNQVTFLASEKDAIQRQLDQHEKSVIESEDEETISKNSKSTNKRTIMNWLENSDLKDKDGAADIIKAICNEAESEDDENCPDISKINEKLSNIEKLLEQIEYDSQTSENIEDETENTTAPPISDGNQNLNIDRNCQEILGTLQISLRDIFNDIVQFNNSLIKRNDDAQDFPNDPTELEIKLSTVQEELKTLQIELQARPTYNQLQDKINLNEHLQIEINSMKSKIVDLQDETLKLEKENSILQSELDIASRSKLEHNTIASQTDGEKSADNFQNYKNFEGKTSLDSDTLNEMAVISNKEILHEEELIIYKEKFDFIMKENLSLKKTITSLEKDLKNFQMHFIRKLMTYGAIFFAFIIYLLFSYF